MDDLVCRYFIGGEIQLKILAAEGSKMATEAAEEIGQAFGIDDLCEVSEAEYEGKTLAKRKPVRHKYGAYQNVLLTDADMDALKTEFPADWARRIDDVSTYVKSTGKSYKDYLATIRNWARRQGVAVKHGTDQRDSRAGVSGGYAGDTI